MVVIFPHLWESCFHSRRFSERCAYNALAQNNGSSELAAVENCHTNVVCCSDEKLESPLSILGSL